ncbi:hypothetical protein Lalb_Chr01g0020491 [Lupinus albus]|uniref:Uncharacterized protein n=1 Tax=Lupinus albus TaxID=3870 RepID=A0A6A4R7N9_LUPAL|nr:hypothetical protein Lalb_Chr01g0020491 [Lupinus albus]
MVDVYLVLDFSDFVFNIFLFLPQWRKIHYLILSVTTQLTRSVMLDAGHPRMQVDRPSGLLYKETFSPHF